MKDSMRGDTRSSAEPEHYDDLCHDDPLEAEEEVAMEAFFRPRGIAVIGASRKRGTIGGELLRNLLDSGFQGPVYPVNPKAAVVQSVAAYPSVQACPGPVDLAFVVIPAKAVIPAAKDCVEAGVRALVIISAGFGEVGGEGESMQQELVEICRKGGARIIGPNCMGIANTDPTHRINGQFAPVSPSHGRIGFLSQSGALGVAIIDDANKRGLGMSTFVSVGNKADISSNDLLKYWGNDPSTDLIVLYLESFGNPRKFARIARRISRSKPVIAVKGGRTTAGFRATQSHTGALVSASDITVDALFQQSGVIRTDSLEELFDVAGFLASQPLPKGDRVGIVTNAGGIGILAADACEANGLTVPELSEQTKAKLRENLPPAAGVENPVDMIASATPDQYGRTIRILAEDPKIDALIVLFIPPLAVQAQVVAKEILAAAHDLEGRVPLVTSFLASHGLPETLAENGLRIPSYRFPESASRALARAVEYSRWLSEPPGRLPRFADAHTSGAIQLVSRALEDWKEDEEGRWLAPTEVSGLLSHYGIPLVEARKVSTAEEAARAASELGRSVAIKAVAPSLVHKTEAGAVLLDVEADEVEEAVENLSRSLRKQGFEPTGYLLQPMISGGVEMLVGVTHDPTFGPVIACGAGGTLVELLKDLEVRVTPLTDREARKMIRSLRTYPLLEGYRGSPPADIEALEEILLRVGRLVEDVPRILEIDLNPVIVLPRGQGVAIVDARVRVGELPAPPVVAKKH